MKSARVKTSTAIMYKNDISTTKLKLADLTTALPWANFKTVVGYTNAELWFLQYVTGTDTNLTDYSHASSGFWTSEEVTDIDQSVGTEFPSFYFTNIKVNNLAYDQDSINDVLFAAKKFVALNTDQSSNSVYLNMSAG